MIPVLGIPHYNRPDLLCRCVASIDYPVERLVIVQNGPDSEIPWRRNVLWEPPSCIERVDWIVHPNAGVAGAWNEVIKLYPSAWWMLANNDIQFTPGDLRKMAEAVMASPVCKAPWQDFEPEPASVFYGNHGASWWALTAYAVWRVGLFDENLYPAYLEDCDWSYRCDLAGVKRVNVAGCQAVHGDGQLTGSCTVNSDPVLQRQNGLTHGRNFEYYRAKWGGNNGEEKFKHPFDNRCYPVDYWKFSPIIRARQQWRTPCGGPPREIARL